MTNWLRDPLRIHHNDSNARGLRPLCRLESRPAKHDGPPLTTFVTDMFLDAWYWIVDGIFFFVESDMEKCEIYNKNKIIDPILHIFAKFLISNTF